MWNRLGNTDAISWVVFVVIVIVQTAGSFLTSQVAYEDNVGAFLVARTIGFCGMFVTLGAGRLLLTSRIPNKLKPGVTVATFLVTIFVGTWLFDAFLVGFGLSSEPRLASRLVVSGPGIFITILVTAVLVDFLRESSRNNQRRETLLLHLMRTRSEAHQRQEERRQKLVSHVDAIISRELASLQTGSLEGPQREMERILDEVVRPLSYRFSREIEAFSFPATDVPTNRIRWIQVFETAVNVNPFHPLFNALWVAVLGGAFLGTNFGVAGVISTLVLAGLIASLGEVARQLWPHLPNRVGFGLRCVFVTAVVSLSAWLSMMAVSGLTGLRANDGTRVTSWILICVIISWSIALFSSVITVLASTNEQLGRATEDLQREVVAINTSNWQLQRTMSRVLHGSIQREISASIHRIQKLGANHTPQVLTELRTRIDQALKKVLTSQSSPLNLAESLSELVELWSGITTITVTVADEDLALIERDQRAVLAIHELASEACNNAIKHGDATRIDIDLIVDRASDTVRLNVVNDGTAVKDNSTAGFGSSLFNEMCLTWSRAQVGDDVVVEASIPISVGKPQ